MLHRALKDAAWTSLYPSPLPEIGWTACKSVSRKTEASGVILRSEFVNRLAV